MSRMRHAGLPELRQVARFLAAFVLALVGTACAGE